MKNSYYHQYYLAKLPMTEMRITVLLLPIPFFFLQLSVINLNDYIHNSEGDNDYLPFQKTNKSINNNFED